MITPYWPQQACGAVRQAGDPTDTMELDLEKSIALGLQMNSRGKVSRASVEAARALHKQALSSWWPTVSAKIYGTRMDQDPNFIFPASQMMIPGGTIEVPPTTITIPANSFAPGLPPVDVPLTTPPGSIGIPAQHFSIPAQDIKLMNRDNLLASLNIVFPIYTGGLRTSRIKQAAFGIEAARSEERRTDLEVVYDIRRIYFSGVLTKKLVEISRDTLARMEATLDLTEQLYQTGSGRVKKTDYLRNKSVVETLRSVVSEIEALEKTAHAALMAVIGLDWNTRIKLRDSEIPYVLREFEARALVERALEANPQHAQVEAGIKAAEAAVGAARSGYFPKVAFKGNLTGIWNSYDMGIVTPQNKNSWTIGVGAEIPIFEGFRVQNEVREARAKLLRLQHQKALLEESIALDVKRACFDLEKTQSQQGSSEVAYRTATENRELNVRAYQNELVETKDVIEAQMLEALLAGQYQKVLFSHSEAEAKLDFVIGVEKDQLWMESN
jgi:outer membrane protein TolC